jgi:hypothetical protein
MSLSLFFLLAGAALVAGSSVALLGNQAIGVRSASAATLAAGALMLTVGVVNALSGTL